MKRTRLKPRSEVSAIRRGSGRRRLIAAKAGRSGRSDTARRIEDHSSRVYTRGHSMIDDLLATISRAFAPVLAAGPPAIADEPCCPEHDAMTEWFRTHTCDAFEAVLDEGTLDAEFMPEGAAFVYFLPAVLRYTLKAYERGESMWDIRTVRGITCAPIANWIDAVATGSVDAPLSAEQRGVVERVLGLFSNAGPRG